MCHSSLHISFNLNCYTKFFKLKGYSRGHISWTKPQLLRSNPQLYCIYLHSKKKMPLKSHNEIWFTFSLNTSESTKNYCHCMCYKQLSVQVLMAIQSDSTWNRIKLHTRAKYSICTVSNIICQSSIIFLFDEISLLKSVHIQQRMRLHILLYRFTCESETREAPTHKLKKNSIIFGSVNYSAHHNSTQFDRTLHTHGRSIPSSSCTPHHERWEHLQESFSLLFLTHNILQHCNDNDILTGCSTFGYVMEWVV